MRDYKLLHNSGGELNRDSIGWNKRPYKNCTIKRSFKNFFRRKRWNHYLWMNQEFVFLFAVVDLDYAGFLFLELHDLNSDESVKKSKVVPLGKGVFIEDEINNKVYYRDHNIYINIEEIDGELSIECNWDEINSNAKLKFNNESLNVLIPWGEKKYHYTCKDMALKSTGMVSDGHKNYNLGNALCFLDYGRGIWPYEKEWYWITSGFERNGNIVGINLGAKWTDGTGVNENGVSINGKVYKIKSDVKFISDDFGKLWTIESVDGQEVNLTFTPFRHEVQGENFGIIKSSLKQYIGYLEGSIKVEGIEVEFRGDIAWFEDHFARW